MMQSFHNCKAPITSYKVLYVVTVTVLVCSMSLSPRRVKRLCVCMISTFLLWRKKKHKEATMKRDSDAQWQRERCLELQDQ